MHFLLKKTGLFILFLLSLTVFSQEQQQDTVLQKLKLHTKKDTVRSKLLIDAAKEIVHNKPQQALAYIDESIVISKQNHWKKGEVLALQQRGVAYYRMADNLKAMEAYLEALKIGKSLEDKLLIARIHSSLANIYADLKQYAKALKQYEAYLSIAKQSHKKSDQVKALVNIGLIHIDLQQIDVGISYLEEALILAKKEKNDFFIAAIVNNLGIGYKRKKKYKKALEYFHEASEIALKIENKYIEASALNSIGKVNILLENYDIAGINGSKALKLSQEMDAVEWQADSWKVLSTVYEFQGDTKKALVAYKNYINLKDSVLSEEKKVELTRKEMQFQLEKQETIANAEIKRQGLIKNNAIIGAGLLIFASLIGYLLYKRKRDALEEKKIANFNTKVAETELKALRSQMNPHFIFNSLSSISDYMAKHDIDTANDFLIKFSKLTRSILENSEKKWISLEEDLELTELYIQIESLRLKNKFSYKIIRDENIDIENTLVPPLILQPFIENSIWHGISPKETNGHILIAYKKENEMLICSVEDDGVGRKNSKTLKPENTSMGVKITKSRLEIINQLKKTKGSLEIFDKSKGLKVVLKLPLERRF